MSGAVIVDPDTLEMLQFFRNLAPEHRPLFMRALEATVAGVPAEEAWRPLHRALGWDKAEIARRTGGSEEGA